jgi:hypothetical protein
MVTLWANHGQTLWDEVGQRVSFLIWDWCVTTDMVTLWADHRQTFSCDNFVLWHWCVAIEIVTLWANHMVTLGAHHGQQGFC